MKKSMKKVVFAAVSVLTLMTSCLNKGGENVTTQADIFKVAGGVGGYSFKTTTGFELRPLNQAQLMSPITASFVLMQFQYDPTLDLKGQNSMQAKVLNYQEITSLPIEERTAITPSEDGVRLQDISEYPMRIFDKVDYLVPMGFYMVQTGTVEGNKKEYAKHQLNLEYMPSQWTADTLVVHLVHRVTDLGTVGNSQTMAFSSYYHLPLATLINRFESLKGKRPEYLKIRYKTGTKLTNQSLTDEEMSFRMAE